MSLVNEILKAMEDTAACCAGPAVDATLVDGFASDAGAGVHVGEPNGVGVSVSNPGHLPLACSHVRGGHIDTRSQETLLGELNGEPPGDLLKLILAVQLGVNLDACLATAEGDINTGTLVSHQSRQGLNLVSAHVHGVTDTTLAGTPVVRMLRPVGIDHLKGAVVALQGEVHLQDMRTRLNDLQDPVRLLHFLLPGGADILHVLINEHVLREDAGLVEEVLHHLKEAGIFSLRNGDKALRDSEGSCIGGGCVDVCKLLDCKGSSSLLKQVAGPLALPQHLHQAACHLSSCCSTHSLVEVNQAIKAWSF